MVNEKSLESIGQDLYNDIVNSGDVSLLHSCIDSLAEILLPVCSTQETRAKCQQIIDNYFARYICNPASLDSVSQTLYKDPNPREQQKLFQLFVKTLAYVGEEPLAEICQVINDYCDAPYSPKTAVPWRIETVVVKTRDVDLVKKTIEATRACRSHLPADEVYENSDWVFDDSSKLSSIVRNSVYDYHLDSPNDKEQFLKALDEFCTYLKQRV